MTDAEAPAPAAETTAVAPRARLFRKYAALFASLVAVALIASGAIEVWFSYQENKAALLRIQREKAEAAAAVIEQFVKEVEAQIGWTTHAAFAPGAESLAQRRVDYLRLLRQAPAITEIGYLDAQGREQVLVSRLAMDVVGSNKDLSADPRFSAARAQGRYLSAVYFRKESEPYLTFGLAGRGRDRGVTVAEVNLKFIWDVVSRIKVGREGHAYVVDAQGLLIAHPDISLVLRKTDLSSLLQVRAARAAPAGVQQAEPGMIADDHAGRPVLASSAAITPVGWTVLVESPLREAFAPLYDSMVRTGILLMVGIALSALAGLWLARRMVGPIQALASGAARIGAGELGKRIEIETGDELEALAGQFNRMGSRLQESYATLERRVEDRTRELSESLEQQTATSEVLRVIAGSPGEADRVLDTIARTAQRLFGGVRSVITRVDGEVFREVAVTGETATEVRGVISGRRVDRGLPAGRAVLEKRTIHIEDLQREAHEFPLSPSIANRTVLVTPLMREGEAIGTLGVIRPEVRPFTPKQIELVESFAAQAVIAIENARLLDELQARMRELSESLEQQTATSEVLRAIASSPGEAERVLDTISRTALRLVGGLTATIMSVDGEVFREVAGAGEDSRAVGEALSGLRVDRRLPAGRAIVERQTIHIEDIQRQADEYPLAPYVREGLGGRAILATPLMREGEAIGTITVTRTEVRPFTTKEIELLESFAAQAVIAIENARLLDELNARMRDLSESLEQQTATSEVLRVIASSPSEPERVLDTIARTTARLFEDTGAGIRLVEGNVLRLVGSAGSAVNQLTRELPTLPIDRSTPSGLAVLEKRQIQIEDAAAPHGFAYAENMLRAGIRTIVATPMLRGGDAVGVLNVYRTTVRPFGDKELQLIASFADQAVIAIENARLLDELQARTAELARSVDELKALGAVGQAVNSTLDLQKVLDAVLVNASALSDAGGGAIYAYNEAKGEFELQAAHGMPDDLLATIRGLRIRLGETAVGQCAARREAVQIPDLEIEGESYPLREALSKAGVRSLLAVPLLREDAIVGALVVRRKRAGEFAKETVDLLQAFASQSTLAIQNARLFLEIEQKSRELEIASQHKSQFLANMSHELRTPLNAILGYTELIVDEVYGATNDKIRGVLERVQANGRHLLGLINDVLDLSKIEAGQLALSLADYSLGDVIQTVVTATEPLAAEKKLAVKLAVPKDLPHGLGDERRIAQVLLNLVGNAIKFTDAGEVGIAASAKNGAFEVAVSDTGPGIPPGEQSKIFEEFHQVDSSSTRKKGGTGLGLSIARKIVEMHGGRIWVDSEIGHGSTFRFTLQVRCAEMAEAK